MGSAAPPAIRTIPRSAGVAAAMKVYREDGAVRIKDFLTSELVKQINLECDPILDIMKPGTTLQNEEVKTFYGNGTKRLPHLHEHSKTYRDVILDDDYFHEACEDIFSATGSYWLNSSQIMQIGPGGNAQPLHRDQWGWKIFDLGGPNGPEAICNFFIGLGQCTEANGATRIIPGSNRDTDMGSSGSYGQTIAGTMDAGDCILFSGKVLHGGGENVTRDSYRKALSISVLTGTAVPEEANPLRTSKDLVATMKERPKAMIGFSPLYPHGGIGLWMTEFEKEAGVKGVMISGDAAPAVAVV